MASELVHWNIRGILDKSSRKNKVTQIISFLENSCKTVVVNVQETHLKSESDLPLELLDYKNIYHIISTFASDTDRGSGITMFINKTEEITKTIYLLEGRLLLVTIKNKVSGETRNIFSFYGKSKNNRSEWSSHINKIKDSIINEDLDNVIILGDFNFVTSTKDRNTKRLNDIDVKACTEWNKMNEHIGLFDSFRVTNPERILYTHTHTDNKSKSRRDRIYVTDDIRAKIESSTFEFSPLSDHKILRLKIATSIDRGPGLWIFNNTMLNDNNFVNYMREKMNATLQEKYLFISDREFWDYFKMNIQSCAQIYAKERARKNKRKRYETEREIEELERKPVNRFTNFDTERLQSLKEQIGKYEKLESTGMILRTKMPHFEQGEARIAFLSRLEKKKGDENYIYSLKNDSGIVEQGTQNIINITYKFYKTLYTKEDDDEYEQNELLNNVNKKLSKEDMTFLDNELTEKDFVSALNELQSNKTPGCDGITK